MARKSFSIRKTVKKALNRISQTFSRPLFSNQEKQPSSSSDSKNRVLMFGWELPPFNSGGLGVACFELAKSLSEKNTDVTFVLPRTKEVSTDFMKVTFADKGLKSGKSKIKYITIDSNISPYMTEESYRESIKGKSGKGKQKIVYSDELMGEVERYGEEAGQIAKEEDCDIIHAHDWLSYPAGIAAKKVNHKPLVLHVHATEYDRCHELGVNPQIVAIEKKGLRAADKIITVSNYTKERVVKYYGIDRSKIEVVHNGIQKELRDRMKSRVTLSKIKGGGKKMVLFVGRITYQKGVDYLIAAAAKVLKLHPKTIFMVVGSGDMTNQIIEQAAVLGISDKVFFPGFLRGSDLDKIYQSADVYVMPSVSEPFGLVALEALSYEIPVIVSKQSGVCEVLKNSLKINFWEVDELANQIVAVLRHKSLRHNLITEGMPELHRCSWDLAADKCIKIYNSLIGA